MGVKVNIGFDRFPKQGHFLGRRTRVYFHYENRELMGTIIRDDAEDPFKTLIRLDDGRVVLSTECQYAPFSKSDDHEWPEIVSE